MVLTHPYPAVPDWLWCQNADAGLMHSLTVKCWCRITISGIPAFTCGFSPLCTSSCRVLTSGGSQRDVVYLCWPIAPSQMSPNVCVGGCVAGSQWVQLCTWSSNIIWSSYSIFNGVSLHACPLLYIAYTLTLQHYWPHYMTVYGMQNSRDTLPLLLICITDDTNMETTAFRSRRVLVDGEAGLRSTSY